jgi:2-oxoglutarate dehydrogenase E1 component
LRKAKEEDFDSSPTTAVSEEEITRLFNSLMQWPADFQPLKKSRKTVAG